MWIQKNNNILVNSTISKHKITNFVSLRAAGNMADIITRNKLLSSLNIDPAKLVTAEQVHEEKVYVVKNNDAGKQIPGVDGLITAKKGIPLAIRTADCVPLFLFDTGRECIGLIHCGRKSIQKGIVEESINKMLGICPGIKKSNILAAAGPHICHLCYQVSDDIGKLFPQSYKSGHLNLGNEIKLRLMKLGIPEQNCNIVIENCTYHGQDMFFSYRCSSMNNNEPGKKERLLSLIMLN